MLGVEKLIWLNAFMTQHFKVRQYFLSEQKKQKKKSHLIILCFIKVNCFYIYIKKKKKKKKENIFQNYFASPLRNLLYTFFQKIIR